MPTIVLPSNTLISTLMPSGGGSLASGDTIELNGYDLIIDADAVDYPVTLTNAGNTAHLELRNGGRIGLNATLPTSICPWVDPENPLPESNYTAGLTGNASAEIQLRVNISLGGGPASLPTATRPGNFWAIVVGSDSTTTLQFDRDFPLRAGDYVANLTVHNAIQRVKVVSYDSATYTATLETAPSRRTVGDTWLLVAGGVCLHKVSTSAWNNIWMNAPASGGTLTLFSPIYNSNANMGAVFDNSVTFDRVLWGAASTIATAYNPLISINPFCHIIGQLACGQINTSGVGNSSPNSCSSSYIGECIASNFSWTGSSYFSGINHIDNASFIGAPANNIYGTGIFEFKNTSFYQMPLVYQHAQLRMIDCKVGGVVHGGDITYLSTGTVTRVLRSNFPVDTDLPDAFFYVPATSTDTSWKYEDYFVRKGEILRIAIKASRGGSNSIAKVAIGEMLIWCPDDGMPTLAEWKLDSGNPLEWVGGNIQWTNNTGEDTQVRVWGMSTGSTDGAYIRFWRNTGGIL